MSESNTMRLIMLAIGKIPGVRIFRNNTGKAWVGKSAVMHERKQIWVNKGDVIIEQGRFFIAGLCVGSSDLIGFKSVTVTPDMVGKTVAIFIAPEIKAKTGRLSNEQKAFHKTVNDHGGIAYVATDEIEAVELLNKKT